MIDDFRCVCVKGFSGKRCEIRKNLNSILQKTTNEVDMFLAPNPCRRSPCRNGATCVNNNGKAKCVCKSGFTGTYCEKRVSKCPSSGVNSRTLSCIPFLLPDPCYPNNPCKNGARCYSVRGQAKCQCQRGFSGRYCEIKSTLIPYLGFDAKGWIFFRPMLAKPLQELGQLPSVRKQCSVYLQIWFHRPFLREKE